MIFVYSLITDFVEGFKGSDIPDSDCIKNQPLYRNLLEKELRRFPSVGLYDGETKEDWDKFVQHLETVYNDIDGERREIIDKVKIELNKRKQYFDDLLSDIGLNCNTSIRRINNRLSNYICCPEYKQYIDLEANYQKALTLMNQYQLPDSDIKQKILVGLRKKYSEDVCQDKLKEVIEKNQKVVQSGKQQLDDLLLQLEANDKYKRQQLMLQELKVYREEWKKVDSNIGKENISKGKSFEDKCLKEGVDLILRQLKLKKRNVKVLTNLQWAECPGEIDIAIFDKDQTRVLCLAECKSRLFDLVSGYKQSGPGRSPEKQSIKLFQKNIPVPRDVPCFVLTCLPPNDYFLGIESKVKLDLNKYTLESEFDDINFDEVYNTLRPKYEKQQSPLKWFEKYSETNLFVLN
ncbi:hypothetical protein ABPG72_010223 [Tetrahymena utriculariae]